LVAGAGFSLAGATLISVSIVPIVSDTYFMIVVRLVLRQFDRMLP